ncbi:MAG: hypothetical protein Q9227_002264 [Pyrenula ochraceoflavens]
MSNNTRLSRLALDLYDRFVANERYPAGDPEDFRARGIIKFPNGRESRLKHVIDAWELDATQEATGIPNIVNKIQLSQTALQNLTQRIEIDSDSGALLHEARLGDPDLDSSTASSEADITSFRLFDSDSEEEDTYSTTTTVSDEDCENREEEIVIKDSESIADSLERRGIPRLAVNGKLLSLPDICINNEEVIPPHEDEHEQLWVPSRDRHARRLWLQRVGSNASD